MDEMFRDLSQPGKTGKPRQSSAGDAARGQGPSYMQDLSGGHSTTHGSSAARDSSAYRSAPRTGGSSAHRTNTGSRSTGSYGRASEPAYRTSGSSTHRSAGSLSSGRSGGSRSSASAARRRRQRQKRQRAIFAGFVLLLLLLAATVFVVIRSCSAGDAPTDPSTIDPSTATFAEEVYVNGILLTDKTLDEARQLLMPGIEQIVSRIAITLTGDLGGQTFHESISAADMNISSDIEQVLLNALAGGKGKSYNTALAIDYTALDSRIAEISSALTFGPTDATFSLSVGEDGEPNLVYTDGRAGMGIDIPATEQLVREALESGNYQASLTPQLTQQAPNITVDDLKKQVTLIGSYTTSYRHKGLSEWTEEKKQTILNRAFNVNKAAELINGQVVQPGKTWSYNDTVGDRNEQNGWKLANAIVGGETYRAEYGGGVCQVSSTLYNALLQANIEIVSRRKHSIPADYVPLGLDATAETGPIDFKSRNNTESPLSTSAATHATSSRKSEITVLLYGQALPEGVTYEPRAVQIEEIIPDEPIITYDKKMPVDQEPIVTVEARNGYKVEVYLDKKVNGEVVESTYLYTDEYAAIRQKVTIGTLETKTPEPVITPEPIVTPAPDPAGNEDLP